MNRETPKKKPSGAEFERRRKAAEKLARELLAEEQASGRTQSNLERYAKLGGASADATENIKFANACAAALLDGVMRDAKLTEAERRKAANELIRSIGMTGVRAIYETRLARIERTLYHPIPETDDDGLEPNPEHPNNRKPTDNQDGGQS